jgi:hypothetical protein
MRADAVPHYYGLKLDREEDWKRVEKMLTLVAERVLNASPPDAALPPRRP